MMDFNVFKVEPKINVGPGAQKKSIGILNKGKNNRFVNNKIQGLDVGIQDEGENTLAQDNEIQ
ncbi:hypothetical protein HYV22_00545 [Candidatus Gottesmanbacteria bacterium]|nr:hypothetical protein [Candidatus Gottesmanbacteria bacterium]